MGDCSPASGRSPLKLLHEGRQRPVGPQVASKCCTKEPILPADRESVNYLMAHEVLLLFESGFVVLHHCRSSFAGSMGVSHCIRPSRTRTLAELEVWGIDNPCDGLARRRHRRPRGCTPTQSVRLRGATRLPRLVRATCLERFASALPSFRLAICQIALQHLPEIQSACGSAGGQPVVAGDWRGQHLIVWPADQRERALGAGRHTEAASHAAGAIHLGN